MSKKIKVLVCDDSAIIRTIFRQFLEKEPDIELVGMAEDPYDAREKIKTLNPDVLTLDIEMPKMDGLSFLEKIMTLRPMPVIMVSTLTQRGADATLRALETGAFDFLGKPQEGLQGEALEVFRLELLSKIRAAALSRPNNRSQAHTSPGSAPVLSFSPAAHAHIKLIAIGASTGGVETLRDIFMQLPANLPPIVVVQHMPKTFTTSFAARLDQVSAVNVAIAEHNKPLLNGHAYVAQGGEHLTIAKHLKGFCSRVHEGELVSGHCPSVDTMFESVAQTLGSDALGIILTGMGKDGAAGLLSMHNAGAITIGQNEASCVVYGMPKAAHLLGGVQTQLASQRIPAAIVTACGKSAESAQP